MWKFLNPSITQREQLYSTQLETYRTVFQSAGVLGAVRIAMQQRPAPGSTASRSGTLVCPRGGERARLKVPMVAPLRGGSPRRGRLWSSAWEIWRIDTVILVKTGSTRNKCLRFKIRSYSGKYIGPYSNQVILPRTRASRRSLQLGRSIVSTLALNSPAIGSGQASQVKEQGPPPPIKEHTHIKSIKIDDLPGV
ncbi:hypothetical protein F443_11980 [Phytophthora nicotianae P1569]|uniref:Uncharacterized protein n=2 Tax=Phytophthora nicotianae TaxID=4792 RepID=V9EUN5_PHYNI|nr:hypothetical protein F443_11980 [Phytophthora nicotianae P1569]